MISRNLQKKEILGGLPVLLQMRIQIRSQNFLILLVMQPRAAMRLCAGRMLRRRRLVIKCVTSSPRDLDLSCNVHGGHVRNLDNHWVRLFVC